MNSFMKLAKECAEKGVANNEGGPFGAVIVDSQNNLVSTGNNRVIIDNDPTAHAEMVAIRLACKKLNSYDIVVRAKSTCFSLWTHNADVYWMAIPC